MRIDFRVVAVGVLLAGIVLAGSYAAGRRNAPATVADATSAPGKGTAALPQNHPPGVDAQPQREGKVQTDPTAWFTHFRVGSKNVKSIYADGKLLWVGTSGGVIRYDTATDDYKLYDATSGLLSNGVFHVGKLDGRIVVGTYGGGMSMFDESRKTWETYNVPEGLADAFVYGVLHAKSGDVWIATWSGANRVRGAALQDRDKWDTFTVENTSGGLPNDWVYGLAEGRDGDIWFATEGGLARWRGGKFEHWTHAQGLGADYEVVKKDISFTSDPAKLSAHHAKQKQEMGLEGVQVAYNPNYVVSLAVDAQGVVWAGTWGGGLARFDGKTFRNYTVADGLPGNHVFMLHIDPKGQLWIGTNNGLARYADGAFKVKTTADGLFANTVFSMASSSDGSVWVGSYGGLAHLK